MPEKSFEELTRFMLDLDEVNGRLLFLMIEQLGSPARLDVLVRVFNHDPTVSAIDMREAERRVRHLEARGLLRLDASRGEVYLKDSPEALLTPAVARMKAAAETLSENYFFKKYSFRPFAHFKSKPALIEQLLFTVSDVHPGDHILGVFHRFSSLAVEDVRRDFYRLARLGAEFTILVSTPYVTANPADSAGFVFLARLRADFPKTVHLYGYEENYRFFDEAKFLVVDGSVHRMLFMIDVHDADDNLTGALGYVTEHRATVSCFRRYCELLIKSGDCAELTKDGVDALLAGIPERVRFRVEGSTY